ncbi:MAG: aminodeoxychorismate/anthranilate synthase component II [Armatimonadetes bacterium]|nr:aminodeoxychorismate/anthranilate synthase component II [Armatimonadota bacterium]MDW8122908.1 aminodeoxychorismate/anthranilate synthase component II [Armatimonadota bacterium]
MARVLVIDNYDSFTYNLVQYLGELGAEVIVYRNDAIGAEQVKEIEPDRIVISPGPCTPAEAGVSVDIIRRWAGKIPILGVCLGHQAIGAAFGGRIVRAKKLMHGKTSFIRHDQERIFANLENPFEATRYHSLVIEKESLPDCLTVTAVSLDDQEIMGVRHKDFPPELSLEGVQFHPESILTTVGKDLLKNFLNLRSINRVR